MWAAVVPRKAWFVLTPSGLFQTDEELLPYVMGEDASVARNRWILRYDNSFIEYEDESEAKEQGRVLALMGHQVELLGRVITGNVDVYYLLGDIMTITEEDYLTKLLREATLLGDEHGVILFEKDDSVATPEGFITYTKNLLDEWDETLPYVDPETVEHFQEFLESKNWDKMSQNEKDRLFAEAGDYIPPSLFAAMPELVNLTNITTVKIGESTREHMVNEEKINIGTSLSVKDTQALNNVSKFGIAYFPDSFTTQNMSIAQQLQSNLERTMADGLHYTEAVKELNAGLPKGVENKRNSWMNIAAHSLVGNARSRSRLQGYLEGQITKIIVTAVLDQATTPICEFLDGQVVDVIGVSKRWDEVEEAALPVDQQFPWFTMKTPRGGEELQLLMREQVVASGPKELGGAGLSWKKGVSTKGNVPSEFGLPGYHPLCRSDTYYDYSTTGV